MLGITLLQIEATMEIYLLNIVQPKRWWQTSLQSLYKESRFTSSGKRLWGTIKHRFGVSKINFITPQECVGYIHVAYIKYLLNIY